jgi:putative Mn2+ efflux pump MntP
MLSVEILLLGLALAVDASVATFALSLLHERDSRSIKIQNALLVSVTFGLFQCFMLWLGSYGGYFFTYSRFGFVFQFLVGIIFLTLGLKCFQESLKQEVKEMKWGLLPVIVLGIATSIDALASGISLGTIPNPHIPSIGVGLITTFLCGLFYLMGQFFKKIPDQLLMKLAALIFLFLGGKIFWEMRHLFFRG